MRLKIVVVNNLDLEHFSDYQSVYLQLFMAYFSSSCLNMLEDSYAPTAVRQFNPPCREYNRNVE